MPSSARVGARHVEDVQANEACCLQRSKAQSGLWKTPHPIASTIEVLAGAGTQWRRKADGEHARTPATPTLRRRHARYTGKKQASPTRGCPAGRPSQWCARHGVDAGGGSPLRALVMGTASRRQLRRSDAGWEGSRRPISDLTNINRIEGRRSGVTRHWTGTPESHPDIAAVDPAGPE